MDYHSLGISSFFSMLLRSAEIKIFYWAPLSVTLLSYLFSILDSAIKKPVWVQKREIPSASGRRSSLYRHTGTSLLDPVHISPRGIDPGGQIDRCPPPQKKGAGTLVSMTPHFCFLSAFVHMVLWYNATIAFSSESDIAGNTQWGLYYQTWRQSGPGAYFLRPSGLDAQSLQWNDATAVSSPVVTESTYHFPNIARDSLFNDW